MMAIAIVLERHETVVIDAIDDLRRDVIIDDGRATVPVGIGIMGAAGQQGGCKQQEGITHGTVHFGAGTLAGRMDGSQVKRSWPEGERRPWGRGRALSPNAHCPFERSRAERSAVG
ncbi:hypothetical protein D3C72_1495830 [compost metagenome]